jgi:hypothetical protein
MEPRRRWWSRAACAIALPLGTLTALFPGAVLRGESFYVSDLAAFHRPIRSLLLRLSHESGGLPLWNPYLALGQPYAANPHYAVFHPTTALFFLLPFETAFRWQVMLPVLGRVLRDGVLPAHARAEFSGRAVRRNLLGVRREASSRARSSADRDDAGARCRRRSHSR